MDSANKENVYLVSYPRSGNTWMRYLLANIIRPDDQWHINNIDDVIPDMYQVDVGGYDKPIIIKSHEPYTEDYSKVIYMYRDGRDVAVSYYNLSVTAYGYSGTFEEFIGSMLKGDPLVTYGSWQDHVTGWLEASKKQNVLYVKYEMLCSDTINILEQVVEFMNINSSVQFLESAIRRSEFSRIREDVRKYSPHYANGFRGGVKGGPGKWREVFSEQMNELFWSHTGDLMVKLGYTKS